MWEIPLRRPRLRSQGAQRGGEAADPGERGEHPPAGGRDPPWIPTALPGGAAAAVSPRAGIGAVQRVGRLQDGAVGRKGPAGAEPRDPPGSLRPRRGRASPVDRSGAKGARKNPGLREGFLCVWLQDGLSRTQ